MLRHSFCAALVALSSGAAIAADAMVPEFHTVRQVPLECFVGDLRPGLEPSALAGLVYDNSGTTGITSNTANQAWGIDDVTLDPGNATAEAQLITAIEFAFVVRGTTGQTRDFDVLIQFVDNYSAAAPAGAASWTGDLLATPARVQFRNVAQNGAFTTGSISLATLPGGGIQLTDRNVGVDIKFVEPGTTTLIAAPAVAVTHGFFSNYTPAGTNLHLNGHGSTVFWLDADNDNVIETTDLRLFAWPTHARYYLRLTGSSVRCPGDFNGDGQADFFDYLDYSIAFDAGCD
ncbi:MAG: hypothetical protein SFZ23_10640 [Planctomycetota bacterium]|nr:hypothetical protein [Planctomycetota bacterium]